MADVVKHGKGTRILIGAHDFSGLGRSIDLTPVNTDMADATTFSSVAKVKSAGSYKGKVDHKGIYSNVVSGWDNWLVSKLGSMSGQPISILPGITSNGDVAYHGEIKSSKVSVPVSINDVIAVEASYEIHKALARGKLMADATVLVGQDISGIASSKINLGECTANDQIMVTMHITEHAYSGTYQIYLMQGSGDSIYTRGGVSGVQVITGANSGNIASAVFRHIGSCADYLRIGTAQSYSAEAKYTVVASKIHKSE